MWRTIGCGGPSDVEGEMCEDCFYGDDDWDDDHDDEEEGDWVDDEEDW